MTDTETACWVYAVVPASTTVPDALDGVGSAPVRTIVHEGLAAVVGDVDLGGSPGSRADLLAHHDVLDTLRTTGPVVPVQFGSVLADDGDVRNSLLEARADVLHDLLEQLAGRSQLNLRARYVDDVVLGEVVRDDPRVAELRQRTQGADETTSYVERVRLGELVAEAIEHKRDDDAAMLLDRVLPLTAGHVLRETGGTDVLDVALLVDDELRAELEDLLESLAEGVHERIRMQLVGPVAPFDFAGGI
ncbi:MAG: GvpL/GvpF family gas vesicle protein [Nocardioidaceae bacterium]|nr:GvpL/GvpF family gas vesicle protein [Nocardioidaceae bacterium]